jgi:hypothetical protein
LILDLFLVRFSNFTVLVNIISPQNYNGNEDKQRGKMFAVLELLMNFKQIEKLVSLIITEIKKS